MYINDQETFDRWLSTFNPVFYVGIDTEFIRKSTFFPKLVLFQISSKQDTVVIDVLQVNIRALIEKIQDNSLIKIFFSGLQDLEAIFCAYDVLLAPVFDIQIACDFLPHRDNIGFQEIVEEVCHIQLKKEYQKINWEKRPLSKEEIAYAYEDAFYLIPVFQTLKKKLKKIERYSWVLEESSHMLDQVMDQGNLYFEKKIFHPLSRHMTLQKELVLWRESYARLKNVLRKQVYSDAFIHEVKELFWDPIIEKDYDYPISHKQMSEFRKISKKIFRLGKEHNISKKYFDYPIEMMKLCFEPTESNLFLTGWRNQVLKLI